MDKSESYLAAPEHRECYDGLIKSYDLDKSLFSTYDKVYLLKRSRKMKNKMKRPCLLDQPRLKKSRLQDAEPTKRSKKRKNHIWLIKGDKLNQILRKSFIRRTKFVVADSDIHKSRENPISNLTQETLLGPAFKLLKGTRTNFAELEYDFKECYKALSEKLDWNNPKDSDYPFDLTKPLPLIMNGNRQMVSVDYFFNNDLKYLQGESRPDRIHFP
ncbi:hypothetical protein Tco_0748476 [Tanacetum coccineum]|uniref:Uncharacterized protein n=1 Tax=Tanacetum coccineum TaxID=301880 RepID=A0ABQ4YWN6_9ASTR